MEAELYNHRSNNTDGPIQKTATRVSQKNSFFKQQYSYILEYNKINDDSTATSLGEPQTLAQ